MRHGSAFTWIVHDGYIDSLPKHSKASYETQLKIYMSEDLGAALNRIMLFSYISCSVFRNKDYYSAVLKTSFQIKMIIFTVNNVSSYVATLTNITIFYGIRSHFKHAGPVWKRRMQLNSINQHINVCLKGYASFCISLGQIDRLGVTLITLRNVNSSLLVNIYS